METFLPGGNKGMQNLMPLGRNGDAIVTWKESMNVKSIATLEWNYFDLEGIRECKIYFKLWWNGNSPL